MKSAPPPLTEEEGLAVLRREFPDLFRPARRAQRFLPRPQSARLIASYELRPSRPLRLRIPLPLTWRAR